jgi:ubiquitin C-terminal hydrolase
MTHGLLDQRGTPLISNCSRTHADAQDSVVRGIPKLELPAPILASKSPCAAAAATATATAIVAEAEDTATSTSCTGQAKQASGNTSASPTSVANNLNGGHQNGLSLNGHKNGTTSRCTNYTNCTNCTSPSTSTSTSSVTTPTPTPTPTRAPKFSSASEAPIVMSPESMASLLQDVHFTETEDMMLPFATHLVRVHALTSQPTRPSIHVYVLDNLFSTPWDTRYSTFTRHSQHPHAWIGLVIADLMQKITIQRPLRSPWVIQRMISLVWNRGPPSISTCSSLPALQQPQSLQLSLPTASSNVIHRIFSSSTTATTTTSPPTVQGIPNYGQTCFLNVVLQSLASLDSVMAYVEWIAMEQQRLQQQPTLPLSTKHYRKKTPTTTTVSQLLLPLLHSLNGQHSSSADNMDPRELLWRIAQKNTQFQTRPYGLFGFSSPAHSTGEQQDAQELLQALLEMMIVDAKLQDPPTQKQLQQQQQQQHENNHSSEHIHHSSLVVAPSQMSGMSLSSMLLSLEEKKDEEYILQENEDEVLTVLSDRWMSPRTSSNNSLCGDEPHAADSAWNHVHMVDATGILSSYDANKQRHSADDNHNYSSLSSSFLSTTSTVVTSNSRDLSQLHQPPSTPLSASMQIMLSTISSTTKTPLSCWTGSLVQCQTCHVNRGIRNQEWRDIPIVPTALRNPAMMQASQSPLPPCRLHECLQNFTQVERVTGVDCGFCTLQRDIRHWQGEVDLLRGAVESLERRSTKKTNATNAGSILEQGELLRLELEDAEAKVRYLMQQDPDDYDPRSWDKGDGGDNDRTMIRSDALKCLVLTRLPSVLCLHVQRRYYDHAGGRMCKTLQHVYFDEMLDLAPYCAYGGGNINAQHFFAANNPLHEHLRETQPCPSTIWYRLTSVIEHKGNAFGGHYVCYRRLPAHLQTKGCDDKKWYYCSDDAIHVVRWDQVQRAQAYMLFYEAM